jgi:hypothetical protein
VLLRKILRLGTIQPHPNQGRGRLISLYTCRGLNYFSLQRVMMTLRLRPGCGLLGCFDAKPFTAGETTHLTEVTLGAVANYHWHAKNTLNASLSIGHEGFNRAQLINTFSFKQAWFFPLEWRRDEFENDGVNIIGSGVYFDIRKAF